MYKQFDAAYPPSSVPPGCSVVAGYIGGIEATHTWSNAEWAPFSHLYQVPIWVPALTTPGLEVASNACNAAKKLGWDANGTRIIVFDIEEAISMDWWDMVSQGCAQDGFIAAIYGSLSTVLGNAASVVWSADWDNDYTLSPGETIEASQYVADQPFGGTQVDYSAVSDWWVDHAGTGPRWNP